MQFGSCISPPGEKPQEFEDIYDVKHEIGQGGLCKIYKIEKKGDKIGLIKVIRSELDMHLKEAKDYVEKYSWSVGQYPNTRPAGPWADYAEKY